MISPNVVCPKAVAEKIARSFESNSQPGGESWDTSSARTGHRVYDAIRQISLIPHRLEVGVELKAAWVIGEVSLLTQRRPL